MFLIGILKRLIDQNSNFSVLSILIGIILLTQQNQSQPKSTGQSTGSYKPWFNSECKKAVKDHQNAMDKCR